MASGWSHSESPFHAGELAVQAKLGVQERIDKQGRSIIRDYLLDQHRHFFAQLPFVIVGTVDAAGHPWASILVGETGFLSSPDPQTLKIMTKPLFGDPLADTLAAGADIGLLGIELHTRRRNRLNGQIMRLNPDGFELQVRQSFGNCPQYIQLRRFEQSEASLTPSSREFNHLTVSDRAMIASADTFFIATAYQAESAGAASGVDVSHRGGKPGFVRIDDSQTLTIPDFSGNFQFNTFGNLALNPHAGLLFLDFEQGNLLYLTGSAEVIWQGAEIATYAGAERLLRFRLEHGIAVANSLPLRGSAPEFSPFLAATGAWTAVAET